MLVVDFSYCISHRNSLSSQVLTLDLSQYWDIPGGGLHDYPDVQPSPSPAPLAAHTSAGSAPYSAERAVPGSGDHMLGKRKSPQSGSSRGAPGSASPGLAMAPPLAAVGAGLRRAPQRGSRAVQREVILEETEADVEESSTS